MAEQDPDAHARTLADEAIAENEPTAWFERLYAQADNGQAAVPWERDGPHRVLLDWASTHEVDGAGRSALVIGCGRGRDAEYLSGLGFDTVAFDISETAVAAARRRHPDSEVHYRSADLLDPPAEWHRAFDLVLESLTVQSLPEPPRREAIARVPEFVRPGGVLLVVANSRQEDESAEGPPWPLTPSEIDLFARDGLTEQRRERLPGAENPDIRHWQVEFHRRSERR